MAEAIGRLRPVWLTHLAEFSEADRSTAVRQLLNTLVPYVSLWVGMVASVLLDWPWAITASLVGLAAAFLVRTFIIFHDCCHGSFFPSRGANRVWGFVTGILTLTPYDDWRESHNRHHATAADLDNRGTGDVLTMTAAEYRAAPLMKRLGYRLYRHPLVMFGLGPVGVFVLSHRTATAGASRRARVSVVVTNLFLLGLIVLAAATVGVWTFLLLQLAVSWLAGVLGIWLFYVQHQFPGVYWSRHDNWDRICAAMEGSSYYKLPKVLQWFSGSIGFHHIHHLRPSIPNYKLEACYAAVPEVQKPPDLTLRSSLRSLGLALWNEERQRLVGFRDAGRASAT